MRKRRISNTCIAIMEREGVVYMAGDRRSSWGFYQAQSMPVPKISNRGGMLIGATGSGFLCSLIVDIIKFPDVPKTKPMHYMCNVVTKTIYDDLVSKGFATPSGFLKIPSDYYCEAIIVIKGNAYSLVIENAYSEDSHEGAIANITVDPVSIPYATGCGGQWAWGVLEEHKNFVNAGKIKLTPHESLKRALKIAAKFSPGCDSVIDIISEKAV